MMNSSSSNEIYPSPPPFFFVFVFGFFRYVGGVKGMEELERLVRGERSWGAVSFHVCPVSVEEVMAIADADALMPPKATWFEPKPRSGLIVRLYDDS